MQNGKCSYDHGCSGMMSQSEQERGPLNFLKVLGAKPGQHLFALILPNLNHTKMSGKINSGQHFFFPSVHSKFTTETLIAQR